MPTNPADNPQPRPWRLGDLGLPEIYDAAGDLVTAVGNDFSSLAGDMANARLIVDAVNARAVGGRIGDVREFDASLVRDVIEHGLLDPCDEDAALAALRRHPESRMAVVYLARIAASLERIAEQMPAVPHPAREEGADE